jgi:hypothetical protein
VVDWHVGTTPASHLNFTDGANVKIRWVFERAPATPPAERDGSLTRGCLTAHMTEFDPDRFEEEKYREYFTGLQRAYRNAFETMNDRYDSELVHAIDQQVLDESEPVFEDGAFSVRLPDAPRDRVTGVLVDDEKFRATLEEYVGQIEAELASVFGVDSGEPKA